MTKGVRVIATNELRGVSFLCTCESRVIDRWADREEKQIVVFSLDKYRNKWRSHRGCNKA